MLAGGESQNSCLHHLSISEQHSLSHHIQHIYHLQIKQRCGGAATPCWSKGPWTKATRGHCIGQRLGLFLSKAVLLIMASELCVRWQEVPDWSGRLIVGCSSWMSVWPPCPWPELSEVEAPQLLWGAAYCTCMSTVNAVHTLRWDSAHSDRYFLLCVRVCYHRMTFMYFALILH